MTTQATSSSAKQATQGPDLNLGALPGTGGGAAAQAAQPTLSACGQSVVSGCQTATTCATGALQAVEAVAQVGGCENVQAAANAGGAVAQGAQKVVTACATTFCSTEQGQ